MQQHQYTWTFALDATGKVGQDYKVSAIPTSIFINANGKVTARHVGSMRYDALKSLVEKALQP